MNLYPTLIYFQAVLVFSLLLQFGKTHAQDFTIIAENQNLYSVDINTCEVNFLSAVSPPSVSFADITYTPDAQLWGISTNGNLYRVNPNTGATIFMTTIPQGAFSFYTSLVADQNGLIYTVGSNGNVYTYNPGTDTAEFLGQSDYGSAGDLTFVNGQLVMAGTSNQMIEIDLESPENSTPILNFNVGGSIFGVVTFVEDCENTVTYASNDSSQGTIFSIDFENGDLTPVCDAGVVIYGAASELEFLAAAALELESLQTTSTTCSDPVGSIVLEVSGGNGGLMYSLDGLVYQSSNVFNNLLPGSYIIYVEDSFGCTIEVEAEVESEGEAPSIQGVQPQGTTCGANNGSFAIMAEGGLPPYEFSIDGLDFQNDNQFSDLPAGVYLATVRDAQGCTAVVEVGIDSSSAPVIDSLEADPCQEDGVRLSVTAVGGTMPYSYSINGVDYQEDSMFVNVPGGLLTATVADAAGCEVAEAIDVPEANPLPELFATTDPVSCANSGGTIRLEPGPFDGLLFRIDGGPFSENPVFSELSAGTYTVTVENEAGCTESILVTVEDLEDGPQLQEALIQNTTCGEENGLVELLLESGTPPFSYQLGNGAPQSAPVFEGLASDTYVFNIEDAQGCTLEVVAAIGESLPLNLSVKALPCGPGAGELIPETSGGSGMGIEYRINQGAWQSAPLFDGLDPGVYTVEARDSDGCTAVQETELGEVPELSLALDFVRGCGPGESALQVSGSGGNGGLQYQLNSGTLQSSGFYNGLSSGDYRLSVSDSAGCLSEVLEVSVPGASPLNLNVQAIQFACCANSSGKLTLVGIGGTLPYLFAVDGQVQEVPVFDNLSPGLLEVLITDAVDCTRQDTVLIPTECPVYAPSAFSPNGDGLNDRFELFSGLPFFVVRYQIFDRWGGLLYEAADFESNAADFYWDGTTAGEQANTGYYTYYIEVLDWQEQPVSLEGGVLLVR